jgi:hypothetical protein
MMIKIYSCNVINIGILQCNQKVGANPNTFEALVSSSGLILLPQPAKY